MMEITKGIFYPLKFTKEYIIASLSKSSKAFFAPGSMDQNSLRHVLTFLAHSNGSKMYFITTKIKRWS